MIEKVIVLLFVVTNVLGYSPVVIVPGTGGSQLEAQLTGKPSKPAWYCYGTTSDYFTLWLDPKSLLPYSINCWVDNMRLDWDMKSLAVQNAPGVLTRTPGFGDTSSIETLDSLGLVKYMKPLVNFLTSLGYTRGKDLRGAPYDFRYTPDLLPSDYHNSLKKLVEETYASNNNNKVTLISHSYGCPVTLYFLSIQTQQWKNKYLKQWAPLSGVFGGTTQEINLYSSGYLEGIPNVIVDPLTIRGEQRSSLSNLFMLPSVELWPQDNVIAKTKDKVYKMSDMDVFLKDIGFPEGAVMRKHILNTTHLMKASPGLPIYCFYGNIPKSTVSELHFDDGFPDKILKDVKGDGDGTVNIESLELCKRFSKQQNEPVHVTELPGANHNDVLSHNTVLNVLRKIL